MLKQQILKSQNEYLRNYALDFLKLIFTELVFLSHTSIFIDENTRYKIPQQLGQVCVR